MVYNHNNVITDLANSINASKGHRGDTIRNEDIQWNYLIVFFGRSQIKKSDPRSHVIAVTTCPVTFKADRNHAATTKGQTTTYHSHWLNQGAWPLQ